MLKMSLLLAMTLPSVATAQEVAGAPMLAANTEVPLVLDQEVSSRRMHVGDTFAVSVARDVWVDNRIVIPSGTRGRGVVTWKTGKGAFGKSGKMEIELRSLQLAGQTVPINGKYRQEGRGNTAATVGTIVAAGVIAGMFVTGHSAVFAQGMELRGYTSAPFAAEGRTLATPTFAVVTSPGFPGTGSIASTPVSAPVAVVRAPASSIAVAAAAPTPGMSPMVVAAVVPIATTAPAVRQAPVFAAVKVVPVAVPAPAWVAPPTRYAVSRIPPSAVAPAAADPDRFNRLLSAQRGVHGHDAHQGWTISE